MVHPHARGAYGLVWGPEYGFDGSSPRTWGLLLTAFQTWPRLRFIPTHAGLTARCTPARRSRPVHPHARGAYEYGPRRTPWGGGSSPRTWGLPPHERRAGTALLVHPHARGAYPVCGVAPPLIRGSSPRTWGLRRLRLHRCSVRRFIPTHVGLTRACAGGCKWFSVHPHARGAYRRCRRLGQPARGSSPRTWGLLACVALFSGVTRFIPTHVGLTVVREIVAWAAAVHPHARGAYGDTSPSGDYR